MFISVSCYTPHDHGVSYRGYQRFSETGKECIHWNRHLHQATPSLFPNGGLDQNYCRNPIGSADRPWCYVSPIKNGTYWEYCNVTECEPCLYRGILMKVGDSFHDGCSRCFCQQDALRCLKCPDSFHNVNRLWCYMSENRTEIFPKCCGKQVCREDKEFVLQEYFDYLKEHFPGGIH
ncbi:hypothetical protein ACJMK2_010334 [Sinanodonta woodiana]|uniref:Kringle domain-containing protein n=1 Tax=Sinanodonta woodiana TaxID=1069815 RepID=A0ABD3VGF9_SINWO